MADLSNIASLLREACPFAGSARPKTCPDCFNYSLQVEIGGQTYHAQATDVDKGLLGPLIGSLNALYELASAGQH